MEETLNELSKIQDQIHLQTDRYKEAIRNNQHFEDVKVIYLKIKELEKAANAIMQHANNLHKQYRILCYNGSSF
jgi:hypothetical protein